MDFRNLNGAELNAEVAMLEGEPVAIKGDKAVHPKDLWPYVYDYAETPSLSWFIINRERISIFQSDNGGWHALPRGWLSDPRRKTPQVWGPTPLVAAMRAYVGSKLPKEE